VSVNLVRPGGESLLHVAVENDSVQIAQILISARADVDCTAAHDETPAHFAARSGSPDMVRLLWQAKADLKVENSLGQLPVHLAAESGQDHVVHMLESIDMHEAISMSDDGDGARRALSFVTAYAAQHQTLHCCHPVNGQTPLYAAAAAGSLSVVGSLLEWGHEVDHPNLPEGQCRTALYAALDGAGVTTHQEDRRTLFTLLIEKGSDIHYEDSSGTTVIDHAVACRAAFASPASQENLAELLARGASINMANSDGKSSLHRLCSDLGREHAVKTLKVLLDTGADATSKHQLSGMSPLLMVCSAGQNHWAGRAVEMTQVLVDAACSVNETDQLGRSPLFLACSWDSARLPEVLIARQADVDSAAKDGRRCLHEACSALCHDAVVCLLAAKASTHAAGAAPPPALCLTHKAQELVSIYGIVPRSDADRINGILQLFGRSITSIDVPVEGQTPEPASPVDRPPASSRSHRRASMDGLRSIVGRVRGSVEHRPSVVALLGAAGSRGRASITGRGSIVGGGAQRGSLVAPPAPGRSISGMRLVAPVVDESPAHSAGFREDEEESDVAPRRDSTRTNTMPSIGPKPAWP